jgi:hypothetical protein
MPGAHAGLINDQLLISRIGASGINLLLFFIAMKSRRAS